MVDPEKTARLRALWKSGQDKFSSFYAVLADVRQEIGDEALPRYCFHELLIGISRINSVRKILTDDDAARVRDEVKTAVEKERAHRAAQAHAKALEKIERENELSAKRLQNAELKAAEEREAQKVKKELARAETKKRRAEKAAQGGGTTKRIQGETEHLTRAREFIRPLVEAGKLVSPTAIGKQLGMHERTIRSALLAEVARKEAFDKSGINPSESDAYAQYVAEGRRCIGHQWTLGELAIDVAKLKSYGDGVLARFAYDIGAEYSSLRAYRATAEAWPRNARRIAFSIAMILTAHPNRFNIATENPHMTCEEAREIMRAYKAETNIVPLRG